MQFLMQRDRCYATSVLSNVGRVFAATGLHRQNGKIRTGELVLESVESAPPVRPQTPSSFTLLSYAGTLTLVMNYDRYFWTPQAAHDFMSCHVRQLEQTARRAAQDAPVKIS
jgi:hypothetical protein